MFRKWKDFLPVEIELFAIQLPGREMRMSEQPYSDISRLVESLASSLQSFLNIPFIFFGHSLGALISFELSRQLRRMNAPLPSHLIVSGCNGPHIPITEKPIRDLPESEFIEELRTYKGTPEEIFNHKELLELILPTLRADFAIYENYVYKPEPPLDTPITAFGGIDDPFVNISGINGWSIHTNRAFRFSMLPGDHFFLHKSQHHLLKLVNKVFFLL